MQTYNKIYGDAKDKYVSSVVLYGHSDTYLYLDEEHTNAVDHDTLLDLCMKGLVLVKYENEFYHPVSFVDNTSDVTVVIATAIDASSSTSVSLKSKEAVA